jgi:hypothetical protein
MLWSVKRSDEKGRERGKTKVLEWEEEEVCYKKGRRRGKTTVVESRKEEERRKRKRNRVIKNCGE